MYAPTYDAARPIWSSLTVTPSRLASPRARRTEAVTWGTLSQAGASRHAQPPSWRCRASSRATSEAMVDIRPEASMPCDFSLRATPMVATMRPAIRSDGSCQRTGKGAKAASSVLSDPTRVPCTDTFSEPPLRIA